MNSPVSFRDNVNTPPPTLPSRTRTSFISPRKEDVPDDDDDDSDSEDVSNVDGFSIRGQVLPAPPSQIDKTIQELHSLIHEGTIDLNPPYQRDQALLIDSLFRNFWIPPVVFAVMKDEDGVPTWVCVDGKQHSTVRYICSYSYNAVQLTFFSFLDGQLPYMQSKKEHFYFTAPESTKSRLQIPEQTKRMFLQKKITCVEYGQLTPALEREIFQRVQLGMALTTAEKLAAIASPWSEWISKLESRHISIEGGLSQVLDWDTKRGREFQNVAQFVYVCDGYPATENIPTAPKMENWLARVDAPPEQFKEDIDEALNEFGHLASDDTLNFGFAIGKASRSKLAPVEFVYIGVLLYVLRKATSMERAKAVYHLRTDLRNQYSDVRLNTKVGAAFWALINHLKHNPTISASGAQVASTSRRKRRMSEDSDGEYRPTPIKKLGKGRQTRSR
ncbi:hypothetical protein B0H11DRAFT_2314839, partial [Mycena galericulata]